MQYLQLKLHLLLNLQSQPEIFTSFTDPSVGFGLQFKNEDNLREPNLGINESLDLKKPKIAPLEETERKSGEIVLLDEFRDKK